tara:strand:- start:236 stop:934 length:699 start_codon:yes stop_codon:yes gene_type:complete
MKVVAIIPARSGSKGIHLKNIKKLNGKPLIQYTIDAAKKCKMINRIVVSTDSKKIANISKKLGVEVPFLRPKKISGDVSSMEEVVTHTINFLKSEPYNPDIIIILQPTSPFRSYKEVDKVIRIFSKSRATSLVEVKKTENHPYKSFKKKNRFLLPLKTNFQKFHARQTLPDIFYPTGSVYILWTKTLEKFNSIYGNKILSYEQKDDVIDIDTQFDFFVAEMMIKLWRSKKKK